MIGRVLRIIFGLQLIFYGVGIAIPNNLMPGETTTQFVLRYLLVVVALTAGFLVIFLKTLTRRPKSKSRPHQSEL